MGFELIFAIGLLLVVLLPVLSIVALLMGLKRLSNNAIEAGKLLAAERKALMPGWSSTADLLGLTCNGHHSMEGAALGRPARVKRNGGNLVLELVVPEPLLAARTWRGDELRVRTTGDDAFDAVWRTTLVKDAPHVANRSVRTALTAVAELGPVLVHKGHLRVTIADQKQPVAEIRAAFDALAGLADVMAQPSSSLRMALDPLEPVDLRIAAVRALQEPSDADAAVLEALLDSSDSNLRFEVAMAVKHAPTLLSFIGDETTPLSLRKRAGSRLAPEHGEAVAAAFAESMSPDLWVVVVKAAAANPSPEMSRAVLRVLAPDRLNIAHWPADGSNDASFVALACRALEAVPLQGMEGTTLWLLRLDLPIERESRVLARLVSHATIAHVPALRAVQNEVSRATARRIEAAIIEIQTQSGGEAGAVSVATITSQEGSVSVSEVDSRDTVGMGEHQAFRP